MIFIILKRSTTIAGPKSLPPIPIFTTSVNALFVYPFYSPFTTSLVKVSIFAFTAKISGITFLPSTKTVSVSLARKAVCKTALSSVLLIMSPE